MKPTFIVMALCAAFVLVACQGMGQKSTVATAAAPQNTPAPSARSAPSKRNVKAAQEAASRPAQVVFRLAQAKQASNLSELKLKNGSLWYAKQPVFTRTDLTSVEPRRTQKGQAFVRFIFSQAGAKKLAFITEKFKGAFLVLTLNNSLASVTQIKGQDNKGVLDIPFRSDRQAVAVARVVVGKPQR